MKSKNKILATVLFLSLGAWAVRWYVHKTYPPKMAFNAARLITTDGNVETSIDAYKGNVVIVSCFQTWCSDCAKETPILNQLADNLHSEKFKIIYITDERNDKLNAFRSRLPSRNILFTYSSKSLAGFGINVYPTTYLLDKKGRVIKVKLEGYNWLLEERAIRHLLAE
jgi:thiol-disulfide isomerase/thioredoxin